MTTTTSVQLDIAPLSGTIGAEIRSIDLHQPPGQQPAADPGAGRLRHHLRTARHRRRPPGAPPRAIRHAVASPQRGPMNVLTTAPAAVALEVGKSFDGRTVLDALDVTVARGEFVALLGASGSGKTTLLRILAGLEAPSTGEVLVPEVRTVVYQEPRLVASMRVWRNVVIGLPKAAATRSLAVDALREVGLAERADAWPGTLSGGEAQRVALARALARQPRLLLLDEPFAALDALTRLKMQDLVADLCARHRPGVLLVTHDVEEAVLLADRVWCCARDGSRSTWQSTCRARARSAGRTSTRCVTGSWPSWGSIGRPPPPARSHLHRDRYRTGVCFDRSGWLSWSFTNGCSPPEGARRDSRGEHHDMRARRRRWPRS